MTAATAAPALKRKGVQVEVATYNELSARRAKKMETLAKSGKPRDVTFDEVIRDALGLK
jgi:hypothetical protein